MTAKTQHVNSRETVREMVVAAERRADSELGTAGVEAVHADRTKSRAKIANCAACDVKY